MLTRTLHTGPSAVLLAALLFLLAACTGGDGGSSEEGDGPTPEEVLAEAQQTLTSTGGVSISLETEELPDGVAGVLSAEGVATDTPAFDGEIRVPLAGGTAEVPIISVDGTVYADIPLVPGWSQVDPAEYGAPDPGTLLTESGFPALLPATEDVEAGESVRGGEGNREVLTEYTGTVPAEAVTGVIPSAEGSFDATYTITEDGELREAVLTGAFYPGVDPLSYTVGLDDYGNDPEISAP